MKWDILAEFAADQRARGLSPRTIENRDYMLRALERSAGSELLELATRDLRTYLGRGVSKGSMQTERDCIRAFYKFAKREGFRKKDPSKALEKIRAPRGRPRPFSQAQIDAMLTTGAYRRTRAMILLACYQGFRAAEVAAVHGRDFDMVAGTMSVLGKGHKHAILPLHPVIRELALTMPKDGYWFPARGRDDGRDHIQSRSVSDLMRRAKLRAGITEKRLTGHSLRHAYGSDLVEAGVDLRTVQELMRHDSLATTQIYTFISDRRMAEGIAKLPTKELPRHSGRKAA